MKRENLARLPMEKYTRLFQRALGEGCALYLCDHRGAPVWWSNGAPGDAAADTLAELTGAGLTWEANGGGVSCQRLNGNAVVLLNPLRSPQQEPIGWLAAMPGETVAEDTSPALGPLAESIQDITALIEDEYCRIDELDGLTEELTHRCEELNLVYGMTDQVQKYARMDQFFQHLLATCTDHLDIDVAAVVTPGEGGFTYSRNSAAEIRDLDLVLATFRGRLYHFLSAGRQTVVLNGAEDPRRAYLLPNMSYKVLATPIAIERSVEALLVVLNENDRPDFSNSDRALIELVADQAAIVMRVHRILRDMRVFTKQMASALVAAMEAKDPYIRGHSERVHAIAMRIGESRGLRDEELEQLYWASLLHDVGKIGIPDAILSKPGKLTDDEYTFIKAHPERSYQILRHIDYLGDAVRGARHHQERFDGTGYPQGLKGMGVPLLARIIAVADAFDAITSTRSYRVANTVEHALAEIQRVAGTQLDPEIVDLFLELCKKEPEWLNSTDLREETGRG